jgi:histidinol-phosphate aminotransferase
MLSGPAFTRLVRDLPATVPFVAPDALERQSGRQLRLRLGANEGLFGPSPRAKDAMREALEEVELYGDPESAALRSALARIHRVRPENVVVTSGIDDLMGLSVRAFLERKAPAVASYGAYPAFNYHVLGFGGELHTVPYRHDRNDLTGLAEIARRVQARIVYLANPDNPTGTWCTARDIRAFLDRLPLNVLLLLDEAYVEFAPREAVLPVDADDPRILRMRTFSKAHGMAGARIGYGIGAASVVSAFHKIRSHVGVNRIAQSGALASLADSAYVQSVVSAVAKGREHYHRLARELDLPSLPSATNFVAIDVGGPARAHRVLTALEERGVFVRKPSATPLDRCIRVTVGTHAEREEFAQIFREVWAAETQARH